MKKFLTLLVVFGLISSCIAQAPAYCEYKDENSIYYCELNLGNIARDKVEGDIGGSHIGTPVKGNADVKKVTAIGPASEFVLQKVFNQFTQLETIEFLTGELKGIGPEYFYNCSMLKTLKLNGGNIGTVKTNTFSACAALETLSLSGNFIGTLEINAFNGLVALKELDLSTNSIRNPNANIFSSMPELKILKLSKNANTEFGDRIFSSNTKLEELHLSNNEIEKLRKVYVDSLTSLKIFTFNNNKLNKTERGFFDKLSLTSANFQANECIDKNYPAADKSTIVADFEECFKRNGAFKMESASKIIFVVVSLVLGLKFF